MKPKAVLTLAAVIVVSLAHGVFALNIDVRSFGAVPDDGRDDAPAIAAAIESCRGKADACLIFHPGRYELGNRTRDLQQHGKPLLSVESMDGFTIEGNGAEFVGSQLATLWSFVSCRNLRVRNVSFDWDPLPLTSGLVVATEGDHFDLKVAPPHQARAGLRVEAILEYDPQRHRPAYRGLDYYQYHFERRTELIGDGVMRVYVKYAKRGPPRAGEWVILRHAVYGSNAIQLRECTGTRLEKITVYAAPGMGLYAYGCTDVLLSHFDVRVRPSPDAVGERWMSTTADATHFNGCRGQITIEDCHFEGMGDDAVNVHGMYMHVAERLDDNTLRLVPARKTGNKVVAARVGDRLEIGGGENPLIPYATAIVRRVGEVDAQMHMTVQCEELPAQTVAGDLVGNASVCPTLRVARCVFARNRARGILVQTRDAVIEDCAFSDISGAAVHAACDADYWWESIATRDVVIRNNRFERCNFGAARARGVVDVFAVVAGRLAGPGVHRRVNIAHNTFEDADGAAVAVASADGVKIQDNTFRRAPTAVLLQQSRDVVVRGNRLLEGSSGIQWGEGVDRGSVGVQENTGF